MEVASDAWLNPTILSGVGCLLAHVFDRFFLQTNNISKLLTRPLLQHLGRVRKETGILSPSTFGQTD